MSPVLHSRLVRHLAFWAATLVLSFLMQLPAYFLAGAKLYIGGIFFVQLPASLLTIYPLLYWILPRLQRGQFGLLLLLLGAWVAFSNLVVDALRALYDLWPGPVLFGEPAPAHFAWAHYKDIGFAWFVLTATAGAASALKLMHDWSEQQQLGQRLQQRKLHAELQLLKAQLQPSFLFDTLGTLQALTLRKSPEAPAAVLHLAELLRYLLYASSQDTVPLADEVDMLRHYLALESLRLGPRVEVAVNFGAVPTGATVAPLLLLPLLENAFRHGTGAAQECPWVSIDLVPKPHSLTLKIINSQTAGPDFREGSGLRTLRERLNRLYPGQHELKITAEPDLFLATLHLRTASPVAPAPLRVAPGPAFRLTPSS